MQPYIANTNVYIFSEHVSNCPGSFLDVPAVVLLVLVIVLVVLGMV